MPPFQLGHLLNTSADTSYKVDPANGNEPRIVEMDQEDTPSYNYGEAAKDYYPFDLDYLETLSGSKTVWNAWLQEMRNTLRNDDESMQGLKEWYEYKVSMFGKRKVGSYACIMARNLVTYTDPRAVMSDSVVCKPNTKDECLK
jgi:hypothetical protein